MRLPLSSTNTPSTTATTPRKPSLTASLSHPRASLSTTTPPPHLLFPYEEIAGSPSRQSVPPCFSFCDMLHSVTVALFLANSTERSYNDTNDSCRWDDTRSFFEMGRIPCAHIPGPF